MLPKMELKIGLQHSFIPHPKQFIIVLPFDKITYLVEKGLYTNYEAINRKYRTHVSEGRHMGFGIRNLQNPANAYT
jgi:hypothetical protein